MKPGVLIFDVDNTLYNFVDFFAPSFRSMVHVLAREADLQEVEIIRSAKAVYQAAGTLEYPFLVQEMDIFSERPPNEVDRLIDLVRTVFSINRRRRLQLYPGIINLIMSARASGWTCVCATNAPYYQVGQRLHRLGILTKIDGLVAWEGRPVDASREEHVRKHSDMRASLDQRLHLFEILQTPDVKPSSYPFMRILEHFGDERQYYSVGDSLSKDLQPAASLGASTIWAKYGTEVDPVNYATLLEITPWTSDQVAMEAAPAVGPDYIAESPRDVARILSIPVQADLFLE
ncbi:MAG TPA: HAD family hydrolase [Allosphingosinicella sp.]|jgi:phosphoglycolate phosphatase|nr:HAD family hydrolase [Allosphingosinicella sp.]